MGPGYNTHNKERITIHSSRPYRDGQLFHSRFLLEKVWGCPSLERRRLWNTKQQPAYLVVTRCLQNMWSANNWDDHIGLQQLLIYRLTEQGIQMSNNKMADTQEPRRAWSRELNADQLKKVLMKGLGNTLFKRQLRRKWLPILPSQSLIFNRWTTQILAWKPNLQREENRSSRRKILGVRLRSTNLGPHGEPGTRSRVVEVGGATDDHHANLTLLVSYSIVYGMVTTFLVVCWASINNQLEKTLKKHHSTEPRWKRHLNADIEWWQETFGDRCLSLSDVL